MKKTTKRYLLPVCSLAFILLLGYSGYWLYIKHLNNHWRQYIKKGLSKSEVERILPIKKDEQGPDTRSRLIGKYLLVGGTVFWYDYRNASRYPHYVDNKLFEHGIIDWRLANYSITEADNDRHPIVEEDVKVDVTSEKE